MISPKLFYRALRYRYLLDVHEIAFILEHVKKGDTVADIGAHKGGYTYWLSRKIGASGICYAFEPQPDLFAKLERSFLTTKQVHCIPKGLSNESGAYSFFIPGEGSSPGATLENHADRGAGRNISIETTTLDYFFDENKGASLSFLKIDVEGHELDVLKGGRSIIRRFKPAILVECEERHINIPIESVFDELLSQDYAGFFFYKKEKMPIQKFNPKVHQKREGERYWAAKNYINNFMFIPKK